MPYSLHMPHWPKPVTHAPGTPSERTRALLAKLGHPERTLPPIVHVGGTKGKGSTIAFMRAMLEAAGYRVHVYSSPHIAKFNERIVLAGREIDDAMLFDVLEETRAAAGDMPIGFFDATTAAAMLAFSRIPADILLMEMGLGGTVDATNILDNPRLTVLTTLSYDHMEYMGTTLASIAAFESGLFKPNVPCIVSYQHAEVWPVLMQAAQDMSSALYAYGAHWRVSRDAEGMRFGDAHGEAALPMPALLGAHQIVNAGNAIAAISALDEFDVREEHIIAGLRNVHWKGRLEKMPAAFLREGCECWFDGGHNMAAAQVIAEFAREQWSDKPLYLIFGTTQGKDIVSMLTPFAGLVQRIYGVSVKSEPNSYDADAVTEAAFAVMNARSANSIREALEDIMESETKPFRALVFGSLYLWLEASSL
jgi:dihydrofolate synthase / folylpolyglutamate synthase